MHEAHEYSFEWIIFIEQSIFLRSPIATLESVWKSTKSKPSRFIRKQESSKNFIVISDNLTKHFHRFSDYNFCHHSVERHVVYFVHLIGLEMPIITNSQPRHINEKKTFAFHSWKEREKKLLIWRIPVWLTIARIFIDSSFTDLSITNGWEILAS